MRSKLPALSILLSLLGLTLCSCGFQEKTTLGFDAMDTYISCDIYGDTSAADAVEAEIRRLDELLSSTSESSDIFRLNQNGFADVDALTAEAVSESLEICRETDGALDITVYPVVEEWGFVGGEYKIPDDKTLSGLLKNVGHSRVSVSGNRLTLGDNMKITLGATAKGFAADRVKSLLSESKAQSALINLGGTILAYGSKPNGGEWRVGIADPDGSADHIGYVSCKDKTIATSGSYERFFKGEDGRIYSHIIDPKTGRPVDNGLVSVSIICDSGVKCDGLSTALFVMGLNGAEDYLQKRVFAGMKQMTVSPDPEVDAGFDRYIEKFMA